MNQRPSGLPFLSKEWHLSVNEVTWIAELNSGLLRICPSEWQVLNWAFLRKLTEYTQGIFGPTLELFKEHFIENNLNFQENCKYKNTYVCFT